MENGRLVTRRIEDHIGIPDGLNLAAVQKCRVTGFGFDDMKAATIPAGLVSQHPDNQRVHTGLVPCDKPPRRLAIDNLMLKKPASRCRQMPKPPFNPVEIGRDPPIAKGKPVLDPCAQALCQDRRIATSGNRKDDRIAIHNGAEIEAAESRVVGHIHRHADLVCQQREGFIERTITGLDHDERAAGKFISGLFRRYAFEVAQAGTVKTGRHPVKAGDQVDPRRKVCEKA